MADESRYSSGTESTPLKRKYDDSPTAFSAPPPSTTGFELAKQKAREIAARLLNSAPPLPPSPLDSAKRSKFDNGGPIPTTGFDSYDLKTQYSAPSAAAPVSYGHHQGSSKKIYVPNGKVGVIIGKGGETIKYLQLQSGAKIQVTRDTEADPNSPTRLVELTGTPDAIAVAEKLINEVLAEAESGGSGIVGRRLTGHSGSGEFSMKIPNNKVGLIIGKGGETIKSMQASTGARIQVIPLHLPPGDPSMERTLKIDGTPDQIESAKQLVNQIISGEGYSVYSTIGDTNINPFVGVLPACPGMVLNLSLDVYYQGQKRVCICWSNSVTSRPSTNRPRNPAMSGGYPQQGYQSQLSSSWAPPVAPIQQPGYGYVQPGAYSGPSAQYNMSQPPYTGYSPQQTGGYSGNWDQSTAPPQQQSTNAGGYDYYSQQKNHVGTALAADGSIYKYSQPPSSGHNQPGQGYDQDSYGAYNAPPQSGYGQPPTYDQQQGYSSSPSYGSGHSSNYGSQGDSAQAAPGQPAQHGYATNQQPSPNTGSYPPRGTAQPGYGVPPTSQAAYGNLPQSQKPGGTPPVYGQSQSPSTAGGYGQSAYPPAQQPSSDFSSAAQPGYGNSAPPSGQPGYSQAPPYSNSSYGADYTQPPVYSSDGNTGGSYDGAPARAAQQGGVAKASP